MTKTPQEAYAALSDSDKLLTLEKVVSAQGDYLQNLKASTKLINKRNALAIIELQKLVRDCSIRHPDLIDLISPANNAVTRILDFRTPYDF